MRISAIIAAVLALAVQTGAAHAAERFDWQAAYARPQDARAAVSRPIWEALDEIGRWADDRIDLREGDTARLLELFQADGMLDPSEVDLMEELSTHEARLITIGCTCDPSLRASLVNLPAFRDAFLPVLDRSWATVWSGGADGWASLAEAFARPDLRYLESRLIEIVARQVEADWTQSSMANRYQPVRDRIATLYTANNAAPLDVQKRGRWLLFLGIERADRRQENAIPDFLYGFIKPTEG